MFNIFNELKESL